MRANIRFLALTGAVALAAASAFGTNTPPQTSPLDEKVHHALLMLPYYNVFEDLSYRVDGSVVTLAGEVTRPITSIDAENAVKNLPGVSQVKNEIEVLPLSSFDNRIRYATYYAIYGFAPLQRYGMGTQPSIRILVKNGNVTLAGVVRSDADRNLAYLRANGVPGVFSVTNDLRVAHD